ncbi:hypothetical protein M2267_003011 [Ensifer sp. KUDG1]|uniref:hypothetical protein n=1 Tax=Ensifer sp. KUDG1 TaxID=3373919 RepID=UPI003D21BAB7
MDDDLDLSELEDDDFHMLYLAAAALSAEGRRTEDAIWLRIDEEARRRGWTDATMH